MYGTDFINNQLMMKSILYQNLMNQKICYQMKNNMMNINPYNINYLAYQFSQNNNIMYNNAFIDKRNISYNNYTNKFNSFYPKKYRINSQLVNNNIYNGNCTNNEFINLREEKTSFEENEANNNQNTDGSNTCSTKEIDNPNKINETENKNEYNVEEKITSLKKRGRRLSNISKASDTSKCSKSTLNTSTYSINEKDVSEEINNLK